jgi:hypothetical protein
MRAALFHRVNNAPHFFRPAVETQLAKHSGVLASSHSSHALRVSHPEIKSREHFLLF